MLSPAWSCLGPRVDEIPDYVSLDLCPDSRGSVGALSHPLDGSPKCLLAQSSQGQHCSLELLCPSRWFSLWFLPALLYHTLQQHLNEGAFLRESWDPAAQKCCLRATEILSSLVSFQWCLLPHQSPIIMFQFHVLLPDILFLLPWCSMTCQTPISVGYLSHLDPPISLLPLWSQVRGRGSWHSPLGLAVSGMSLCSWGTGKGVMLLAQSKGLDSESIWPFPRWRTPAPDCRSQDFVQCTDVFTVVQDTHPCTGVCEPQHDLNTEVNKDFWLYISVKKTKANLLGVETE